MKRGASGFDEVAVDDEETEEGCVRRTEAGYGGIMRAEGGTSAVIAVAVFSASEVRRSYERRIELAVTSYSQAHAKRST